MRSGDRVVGSERFLGDQNKGFHSQPKFLRQSLESLSLHAESKRQLKQSVICQDPSDQAAHAKLCTNLNCLASFSCKRICQLPTVHCSHRYRPIKGYKYTYLYIFTLFSPCNRVLLLSLLCCWSSCQHCWHWWLFSEVTASTPILQRKQQKAHCYWKEKRLAQLSPIIAIYRKETPQTQSPICPPARKPLVLSLAEQLLSHLSQLDRIHYQVNLDKQEHFSRHLHLQAINNKQHATVLLRKSKQLMALTLEPCPEHNCLFTRWGELNSGKANMLTRRRVTGYSIPVT